MWKKSLLVTQLIEHERSKANKWTFQIKPVKRLLLEEVKPNELWLDPMSGMSTNIATITNDINPQMPSKHHEDALTFLKKQPSNYFEGVLFDPPYSLNTAKKLYKISSIANINQIKDELARVVKPGGKAICFGWNSTGLGGIRGFRQVRLLSVAHGAKHNDTLITVEVKHSGVSQLLPKDNDQQQQMQSLVTPSKTLVELLDSLAPSFEKLQSKVDRIFEVGRSEGLKDIQIGDLIRERMEQYYSDRTIRNVLPESAKHTEFVNRHLDKAEKSSASKASNKLTFEGRISKASRDRHAILIGQSINVSKFIGKNLKITIEEAIN